MVSFGYYATVNGENKFRHFCGGAIIGSNLVITAAHCFFNPWFDYNNQTVIRAGDEYLNNADDDATAKDYEINTIAQHDNYKEFDRQLFDVALVYTKTEFEFNDRTQKVCLPKAPEDNMANDVAVILNGWGLENGRYSRVNDSLKEARIQTFSQDRCDGFYSKYNPEIHICAGDQVN